MESHERVAVIGAGLAGLSAARRLAAAGRTVTVFEKSRGFGGRLSTRRSAPWAFDHGAQYFTARGRAFRKELSTWVDAGFVAPWPADVVRLPSGEAVDDGERYVGVPGMSAVGRGLAADLDVSLQTRIATVSRVADGWRLCTQDGGIAGPFDDVIVATPAEQAVPLLADAPKLAARAQGISTAPCWAALVGLVTPVGAAFDAAHVDSGPLGWIARDCSKPGRAPSAAGEAWVLHATPAWSQEHAYDDESEAAWALLEAFSKLTGCSTSAISYLNAHRWAYARTEEPLGSAFLWDEEKRIGACGDWCVGARVEAAFESGVALADRILESSQASLVA